MRSLFDFVVKPKGGRTKSKKQIGDKQLILNTELQDHRYVNRVGVVLSVPVDNDTGVNVGDEVIVHHNVFRRFYDVRGKEKNGRSYFDEDTYFCSKDQVYMYKRQDKWKPLNGFCFIKPVQSQDKWDLSNEKPNVGIIKMLGEDLGKFGLKTGNLVGFTPRSEFEFVIEDERMYRVLSYNVNIDYGHKGNEKEYNPSWT